VSVLDSGYMLGDGVWEGLRVHRGVVAFAAQHLERLWEVGVTGGAAAAAARAGRAAGARLLPPPQHARDSHLPSARAPMPPPQGCKALDMEMGITQRQLLQMVGRGAGEGGGGQTGRGRAQDARARG
jgi:hypothetical protein